MSSTFFECKKCGNCCRNLFRDSKGIRAGLVLTAKETMLFPSKMISPQLAIGMKKPKKIILYQLNVDNCPHISQKNECAIYDKRPLMCRAFPCESGILNLECSAVSSQYGEVKRIAVEPSVFEIEIDANKKLNRYIANLFQKHFKKGIKVWEYDLATKNWVFKAKHNRYPHMISAEKL